MAPETLLTEVIEERGFLNFVFGYFITMFTAVATGAAYYAKAVCTPELLTAMFSTPIVALAPCLTGAAIAATSAAMAGGLGAYGAAKGWQFEGVGGEEGQQRRQAYEPIVNHAFGITHNYDAATHGLLNRTHGDMLKSHNTTILSVTWLEKIPTANHTGGIFENLNMTEGRLLTLLDNGVVRVAVGHMTMMDQILDSFNEFKGPGATEPLLFSKKDSELTVSWVSFNTYGENMNESNGYLGNVDGMYAQDVDCGAHGVDCEYSSDYVNFAEQDTGEFVSKYCLGLSPQGQSAGKESMIVGEVYMNAWGGIDSGCDGA